ncbi:MAG: hypothetical protein R3A48_25535 [Polyangiales bacterium]
MVFKLPRYAPLALAAALGGCIEADLERSDDPADAQVEDAAGEVSDVTTGGLDGHTAELDAGVAVDAPAGGADVPPRSDTPRRDEVTLDVPVDAEGLDARDGAALDGFTRDLGADDAARADAARDAGAPADVEQPRPDGGWVQVGREGQLLYLPDRRGDVVPDFSRAGYRGGGVRLPTVATRVTLSPVSGDATAAIQRAIDAVSAMPVNGNGHRGAVLLRAGTWRIGTSLSIRASGVVLRGEGASTVLLGTGRGQRTLVVVAGRGSPMELPGTRHSVADAYVPVGARTLRLRDGTAGLSVGAEVIVHRPSTAAWIHDLGMDAIPPRSDGRAITQWAPGTKDLRYQRVVTALTANTVTLDAPVMNALQREYGGGSVYAYRHTGRIREVGVESLAGDSEYRSATDEDHAWTFISMTNVENAWVRGVSGRHFGYALVSAEDGAKHLTVQDCRHTSAVSEIVGGRRYAFNVDGGQYVLFLRDTVRDGRHDFVTHQTEAGPNVFLDCSSERSYSEAGPHERWATGTLYDNVRTAGSDASLAVYDRSNYGSGHGWSGAAQVFWNSGSDLIRCDSPPTAINWAIGCSAPRRQGRCAWESFGSRVAPASLYRAQLAQRLGPDALRAVAP